MRRNSGVLYARTAHRPRLASAAVSTIWACLRTRRPRLKPLTRKRGNGEGLSGWLVDLLSFYQPVCLPALKPACPPAHASFCSVWFWYSSSPLASRSNARAQISRFGQAPSLSAVEVMALCHDLHMCRTIPPSRVPSSRPDAVTNFPRRGGSRSSRARSSFEEEGAGTNSDDCI